MSDVRGSRFLRMAGGQQFFSDLNKGLQKPMQADSGGSSKMGPNTGTTTTSPRGPATHIKIAEGYSRPVNDVAGNWTPETNIESAPGVKPTKSAPKMPTITPEPTQDDYLNLDQPRTPNSVPVSKGPGSFGKQAEREKFLQDYDIGQGDDTFKMISDYKAINDRLGIGNGQLDVDKMINDTIRSGYAADNVDLQALDRHIRMAPIVDEAKAKLHGLNTYGDVARWRTEQLPDFKMPEPMEAVKEPDFKGMYNDIKGDIKDTADEYDDF